jgi:hypothetical protein
MRPRKETRIRAITGSAPKRIKELEFLTSDRFRQLIEKEGIIVISYHPCLNYKEKNENNKIIGISLLVLLLLACIYSYTNMRDRSSGI